MYVLFKSIKNTDDGCVVSEKQMSLNQKAIEGGGSSSNITKWRAGVTQETCDAASKCLNRNNSDPDDRADKIQPFEGMVKVTVTSAGDALAQSGI